MVRKSSEAEESSNGAPPPSIEEIFRDCWYSELARVTCECVSGRIVLRGTVPSFYLKQVAQELAKSIDQQMEIDNRICVECK